MHQVRLGVALVFGLALGVACSGENGEDAGDTPQADGGVADDGGEDAGIAADSGVAPDSGPCDPRTGGGCTDDRSCVWLPSNDWVQCRTLPAQRGLNEQCSADLHDCAPGMTCLTLESGVPPTCHQVCTPANPTECALPGGIYGCVRLTQTSGDYGICRRSGDACTPLNDMCPQNQVCSLVGSATACERSGNTPVGQSCAQMNCRRGGICVLLTGNPEPLCYQPCDPQNPVCATGQCGALQGLDFGICTE